MPNRSPHLPSRADFIGMASKGRLGFVFREILADAETPVSVYAKLGRGPYSFLLESVVGGEKWAAYSFVGVKPRQVIRANKGQVEILEPDAHGAFVVRTSQAVANPVAFIDATLADLAPVVPPGLPRFIGGAVGFLAYDAVRWFERLPNRAPDELGLPDMCFAITDTVVVFDNLRGTIKVVASANLSGDPGSAWDEACQRIDDIIATLGRSAAPKPLDLTFVTDGTSPLPVSRSGQALYESSIGKIHEYIKAGDAFQVVLSQRFEVPREDVDPFDVYRILRVTNPSPYMFHLEFPEAQVTGASPEALVRLDGRRVEVRPIAGTRPRGKTPAEDKAFEEELKADPKELAEHVMLIDLGRNDVGRVCARGSVKVDEVMVIERYSHVMHIVSNVSGVLDEGQRPADVIRAAFPAGTLSGAPKIRAMQIIDELEPSRRGIYGGAVGYISYQGNVDLAIAIRTLVTKGDKIYIQAGAGVVADSQPAAEYAECENKARAVIVAIERARQARKGSN
ncbi:MAG: anthranilate synthase component I [Deltaproteobacteria bacterium]|nr:anthranilate synthase component I [Deltaproteobacteria bacterium]